jgi:SAM-dependent methyltransferase
VTDEPFDVIADYYDLDLAGYEEDVGIYENLGRRHDLPILELGVGTGRVAIPLLRAGLHVVGIDRSEAMLALARRKLEALRPQSLAANLRLLKEDMTDFDLGESFGLVFCALGGFMHLRSQENQMRALECARRHLAPDGLLVIDLPAFDPQEWETGVQPLTLVWTRRDAARDVLVSKFRSCQADPARQVQHVTHIYEEWGPQGSLRRRLVTFELRYVHRHEMELLFSRAGLQTRDLYGTYDLSPYDLHAPRMIFVAGPVPSRRPLSSRQERPSG